MAMTEELGFPILEVYSCLDFSGERLVRLDPMNFLSAGVLPSQEPMPSMGIVQKNGPRGFQFHVLSFRFKVSTIAWFPH